MDEESSPYRVNLPVFEGPLDLLLHLIKVNEVDIYDIPISLVTKQYLEYLDLMKELNIDVASEYLVMAATLAYIKSKMLLPSPPIDDDEDERDPREELVQGLLEYQRYKRVAEELGQKNLLGRDVFSRAGADEVDEGEEVEEASLFDLMEALRGILSRIDAHEKLIDFTRERVSLKDKIVEILERLATADYIVFQDVFAGSRNRFEVIVTFLAMLELMREHKIMVLQFRNFGMIRIYTRPSTNDSRIAEQGSAN